MASQDDLQETVERVRSVGRCAVSLVGDVRRQEDLDAAASAMIDEFGRIDILVANAGVAKEGLAWEFSRPDWDALMAINLTGVWQSCKAVIPHMINQRYGRVVLISSVAGFVGWAGYSAYTASKAGVIGLGKSLALEVGQYGITVNCICPSFVLTDLNRRWADNVEDWPEDQAIQKLLEPIDISYAVVYLSSDEARYITGVALPLDGGLTAK
jgi:NAD(P)-dependent dehydrogenase (short-subunit alcohol dehydrogenase family)